MKALFASIQTALPGTTLAGIVGTKLYLDNAPMGTTVPYVVLIPVSAIPLDTFTGQIDWLRLQATCVAATSSLCWTLVSAVETFFVSTGFSVTSRERPVKFTRISGGWPMRGGEEHYEAFPEYRAYS